jgi:hypothetical protein
VPPTARCLIDPGRPCGACIAPSPAECPYAYLLADEQTLHRRYGHPAPTDPQVDRPADPGPPAYVASAGEFRFPVLIRV